MSGQQFQRLVNKQQANIRACEQRGVVLTDGEKTAV